jgi:hypothetical protein
LIGVVRDHLARWDGLLDFNDQTKAPHPQSPLNAIAISTIPGPRP